MREFNYIITDPEGIHARPAGELVKAAKEFVSDITISKESTTVSAKRLFAVMALAVKAGQEIKITAEGADEERAAEMLEEFCNNKL